MQQEKQKVWCVVSWYGKETSRYPERKVIHEENGRRYVLNNGLRYRLNEFNEYEMSYGTAPRNIID